MFRIISIAWLKRQYRRLYYETEENLASSDYACGIDRAIRNNPRLAAKRRQMDAIIETLKRIDPNFPRPDQDIEVLLVHAENTNVDAEGNLLGEPVFTESHTTLLDLRQKYAETGDEQTGQILKMLEEAQITKRREWWEGVIGRKSWL